MNSEKNTPHNPTILFIVLGTLFCVLTGIFTAHWLNFNFSKFVKSKEEMHLLTIAEGQINPAEPTAFLPLPTQNERIEASEVSTTPQPTTIIPTLTPPPTEQEIPLSHYIVGIYGTPQITTLDCEIRSAIDWARAFGVSIDENDFLAKLPHSDDPEIGFVGNINDEMGQLPPHGYGVYPPPIANILQQYSLNAQAVKNMTYEDLQREIANDRPVIVWVVNLPFDIERSMYTASTGNSLPIARFEHTWIVTGYNLSTVTVVDSHWTYNVALDTFLERWAVLENRAIILNTP